MNHSNCYKIKNCFIANRGEILKRICGSLKKLGISTTCACTLKDFNYISSFVDNPIVVDDLDLVFYLDSNRLIEFARSHGCDSVHPGYGFLSENPEFARQVIENGLIWIGPDPSSMKILSNKLSSRDLALKNRIPCSRSCTIDDLSNIEKIKNDIKDFNYPLLIKGALSGGGKGIRILESPEELEESIRKSGLDSQRYFGSSDLILEEYHRDVRHVEVQVVADRYSNVFTLGTRDCSVQRRNQKIIEVSPCGLDDSLVQKLYTYSRLLIKAGDYDSIATVEFLVDSKNNVYFLEVNTRLQVEHSVTEMIYGIDLVELQVLIASGVNLSQTKIYEKLKSIDESKFNPDPNSCYSIELRLCSEDPRSFLPVSGSFSLILGEPDLTDLRWDVGIEPGKEAELSSEFDSLIAKCTVKGKDRVDCIKKLQNILNYTFTTGTCNIGLLKKILHESDFVENRVYTNYLEKHLEHLYPSCGINYSPNSSNSFLSIRNLIPLVFKDIKSLDLSSSSFDSQKITYTSFDQSKLKLKNEKLRTTSNTDGYSYKKQKPTSRLFSTEDRKNIKPGPIPKSQPDKISKYKIYPSIPAKVLSSLKKVGDVVDPGDILFLLESMKMEMEIRAEVKGKINYLTDKTRVNTSDLLVGITPLDIN